MTALFSAVGLFFLYAAIGKKKYTIFFSRKERCFFCRCGLMRCSSGSDLIVEMTKEVCLKDVVLCSSALCFVCHFRITNLLLPRDVLLVAIRKFKKFVLK